MIRQPNLRQDEHARWDERRTAPRTDAAVLGPISARLLGGQDCKLLDFSRRGVLIESTDRLLIGARATLRIVTVDASLAVQGRVVRSKVVSAGPKGLVYYTALVLDDDLSALEAAAHEGRSAWSAREQTTAAEPTLASASGADEAFGLDPDSTSELAASIAASSLSLHGMQPPVQPNAADGSEHAVDAGPGAASADEETADLVLEFHATVPHDLAELRRRAAVNNW